MAICYSSARLYTGRNIELFGADAIGQSFTVTNSFRGEVLSVGAYVEDLYPIIGVVCVWEGCAVQLGSFDERGEFVGSLLGFVGRQGTECFFWQITGVFVGDAVIGDADKINNLIEKKAKIRGVRPNEY